MKLRPGLDVIEETEGDGEPVERQRNYRIRLRMWLNRGDPVRWKAPWGTVDRAELTDDGATLTTETRLDRECLINGLFYGMLGMRIGGRRKLRIAPHLAYGERGVPGIVPENALLIAAVEVLAEGRSYGPRRSGPEDDDEPQRDAGGEKNDS
jgi:hypothetical protein